MTTMTENQTELLPCPFCGSDDAFVSERHFSAHSSFPGESIKYTVCCGNCGVEANGTEWINGEPGFFYPEEAVAAWNRRGVAK